MTYLDATLDEKILESFELFLLRFKSFLPLKVIKTVNVFIEEPLTFTRLFNSSKPLHIHNRHKSDRK